MEEESKLVTASKQEVSKSLCQEHQYHNQDTVTQSPAAVCVRTRILTDLVIIGDHFSMRFGALVVIRGFLRSCLVVLSVFWLCFRCFGCVWG